MVGIRAVPNAGAVAVQPNDPGSVQGQPHGTSPRMLDDEQGTVGFKAGRVIRDGKPPALDLERVSSLRVYGAVAYLLRQAEDGKVESVWARHLLGRINHQVNGAVGGRIDQPG